MVLDTIGEALDNLNNTRSKLICKVSNLKSKGGTRVVDGMIRDSSCRIIPKRFPVLEHEELKSVKGIVLHQTNGRYGFSTLARYTKDQVFYTTNQARALEDECKLLFMNALLGDENSLRNKNIAMINEFQKHLKSANGAHFLISPSGDIYQTARIDRVCYHVGKIKALCKDSGTCTKDESDKYDAINNDQNLSQEEKWLAIYKIESVKNWNQRYPTNQDSIGIEVVGSPPDGRHYPAPDPKQNNASKWLVSQLLEFFHLDRSRVFAHGQISPHKQASEGRLVQY